MVHPGYESARRPRRPTQLALVGLAAVAVALATPVGVLGLRHRGGLRDAERARLAERDRDTRGRVVSEVEGARARLGRAPRDQPELGALLGRPLPHVHDGGRPVPVRYTRTGAHSYLLHYELWATDDWVYDSARPDAGWVQHWY